MQIQEARQAGLRTYRTLRPYFNYILTNWVGHPQRRRVMSVYGSAHRTNNTSESGMRVLNAEVGTKGPNVYNFLGKYFLLENFNCMECLIACFSLLNTDIFFVLLHLGAIRTLEDTAWSDLYSMEVLHKNPSRRRKASSIANDNTI